MTVACSRIERATAPEPWAAIMRLQAVAGGDRHHLSRLPREQLADSAGVAPSHRHPGENQRAGIDLVRFDTGVAVLLFDERTERFSVDLLARRHTA